MKARILLDVDGVLCSFQEPALDILSKLLGRRCEMDEIRSWNFFDSILESYPEQERRKLKAETYRRMKEPGWCRSLPLMPGALEGVEMLREIGDVKFVTSPMDGPTWVRERVLWLEKHFDAHPEKDVSHRGDKVGEAGHVIVDDKTTTCVDWQRHWPNGRAIRWWSRAADHEQYDGETTSSWTRVGDVAKIVLREGKEMVWLP